MKKKWLLGLLALCISVATVAFVGCGESDGDDVGNNDTNTEQGGGIVDETPVSYAVTYDANGGIFSNGETTITDSVEENGKLTAPEFPSRKNYAFTYWYKDGALNEIWDFSTDTVTQEMTLYAGWQSTIVDYDVTFVLNYEGASRETIKTVDGLVTYTPKRTGYVFNGWWLADGMTADGEYILAQKWKMEELVTQEGLVLYAEWVEEATQASQLTAPSVTINENTFAWSPVNKAVRYDIRVYQSGMAEAIITETTTSTTWIFPKSYEAGYYNVNIRAIGDGVNTVNSVFATKRYAHKILASASNIQFDLTTSVVMWESVRHATSYDIYVDNVLKDTVTHTTYDMSSYEAGTYSVNIVATNIEYQPSTASATIKKVRLKTPEVEIFGSESAQDYTIVWTSVLYADTYILNLNGNEISVTGRNFYTLKETDWLNGREKCEKIVFTVSAFDSYADWLISNQTEPIELVPLYTLTLQTCETEAGYITVEGDFYAESENTSVDDLLIKKTTVENVSKVNILVLENQEITVTATTNQGYVWLGWYNGNELLTKEFSYKFVMFASNTTYTAKWSKVMLESNDDSAGSVSCLEGKYLPGDEETVTATTNNGYVWLGWYDGEQLLTKELSYTFQMPTENVTYTAMWIAVPVELKTNGGGHVSRLDGKYFPGDEVTITAYTHRGYIWVGWYAGEELLTNEISYTFIIPDSNIVYIAKWDLLEEMEIFYFTSTVDTCSITGLRDQTLKSITIPASVTYVNAGAFWECSNLRNISVAIDNENYKDIDGTLYTKDGKVLVQYPRGKTDSSFAIPYGVTKIEVKAFYKCVYLTSITISDKVEIIEYRAFSCCYNLTKITIPSSVKAIGQCAFAECRRLTNVSFISRSGWYRVLVRENWENKTGGIRMEELSTSSTNAQYFTNTYDIYFWYKL